MKNVFAGLLIMIFFGYLPKIVYAQNSKLITITSPTPLRIIHDQYSDILIPWIQTSPTINVSIVSDQAPYGVLVVLDANTIRQKSQILTSTPYRTNFNNVEKGIHKINAYILGPNGDVLNTPQTSDMIENVGVGDIITILGDSTSAGATGNIHVGTVTNCQEAFYKTTDCRTYEQMDGIGGGSLSGFMIELAQKLSDSLSYPVFIMNEAWSSSNTNHLLQEIFPQSQFQNRLKDLKPNIWLLNLGVNDLRCEINSVGFCQNGIWTVNAYASRLENIIGFLKNNFQAENTQIYLARFSYDTEQELINRSLPYLNVIPDIVNNNPGMHHGPDLWNYFKINGNGLMSDVVHPNNAGYSVIANLWFQTLLPNLLPTTTQTPTPTNSCPIKSLGDINCSGKIDIFDYGIFLTAFQISGGDNPADLDGNGIVNIYDYNILLGNFGTQI